LYVLASFLFIVHASSNEEVLVHVSEARSILKMIWCRKHRWLRHVLRHDNLLHDIIERKMMGKATQVRKYAVIA